jgi:hypothetical protein
MAKYRGIPVVVTKVVNAETVVVQTVPAQVNSTAGKAGNEGGVTSASPSGKAGNEDPQQVLTVPAGALF